MIVITEQSELAAFCAEAARHPFVAVDCEFLRERTYWPELCLVQMAFPGPDDSAAAIIDPIGGSLDLAPLFGLMRNEAVVKAFHAGRQDIEIFHHLGDAIPRPLFDTQVAAAVLGFGDQVGYEALVRRIARQRLDKSSRVTDWSRRPLSDRQLAYALADVTHLRGIYLDLSQRLRARGRESWVDEEIALLTDRATYETDPETVWLRIKTRSDDPRFLAALKHLAAWREREAQRRDAPRGRVIKDDALTEIAAARPSSREELSALRMVHREARKPETADAILSALRDAAQAGPVSRPARAVTRGPNPAEQGMVELLKVLLKARCAERDVAQRMIASSAELEAFAMGADQGLAMLEGWRADLFGADALRLRRGEIALSGGEGGVRILAIGAGDQDKR